jgi:hypothetical protein
MGLESAGRNMTNNVDCWPPTLSHHRSKHSGSTLCTVKANNNATPGGCQNHVAAAHRGYMSRWLSRSRSDNSQQSIPRAPTYTCHAMCIKLSRLNEAMKHGCKLTATHSACFKNLAGLARCSRLLDGHVHWRCIGGAFVSRTACQLPTGQAI